MNQNFLSTDKIIKQIINKRNKMNKRNSKKKSLKKLQEIEMFKANNQMSIK